jgi:phenylacetic acid degradation protein
MAQVYSFEGLVPVVDPTSYVHPDAVLIGDVIVGPGCYIAAGAVLRGDFGRIRIEREANVQDNCTVHSLPDFDCVLEQHAHIGHGAVVHGCHVGRGVLVGMMAVVMDRARVGDESMLAAMSFVKNGGQVPPRVLWAGVPGKVVRTLTQADVDRKHQGTKMYIELARRCLAGQVPAAPLAAVEEGRGRTRWE